VKFIKIYGLQRTRTNYLQHMINTNFEDCICVSNVSGCKHGYVQTELNWSGENWEESAANGRIYLEVNMGEIEGKKEEFEKAFYNDEIKFLFTFRNFYDSFYSRVKHLNNWLELSQDPTWTYGASRQEFLEKMLLDWNLKNNHYLNFIGASPDKTAVLRHEDLNTRDGKQAAFIYLKDVFGLTLKNPTQITDALTVIRPRCQPDSSNTLFEADPIYVGAHHITSAEMKYIHDHIDRTTCRRLEYRILDEL